MAVAIISIVFIGTYCLGFANAMPIPPEILIISPNNQGTYTDEVPLTFTAQTYGTFDTDGRKDGWGIVSFSYSLDNHDNVTLGISNSTLTNLSQGQHSLVIYGEREHLLNGFLATGLRDNFSSTKIYFIVNPLPSTISPATPTPSVPELSWLVIVPLLLSLFTVAVIIRHRKTAKPKP